MPRIALLDKGTAARIAAGEVVERPASVVKELVENSLDAGADRISVEITSGGLDRITVVDNGCGMDREDVVLCLERHATSKVRSLEDLQSVATLGFRGEALPSIAAVSRLTIRTREESTAEGTVVEVDGGRVLNIGSAGCPAGTVTEVRNLFHNTPARKKFMKTASAEAAAITELMGRLALSRPEVRFRLAHNGRVVLETPGNGRLDEAVAAVFGLGQVREMVPFGAENDGIRVSGLAGRPGLTRTTRRYQVFFVNGRYVRSYLLSAALDTAYAGSIPEGRFPVGVLLLKLDQALIDVNVHPAKMEVRFEKGRDVAAQVVLAVRQALTAQPTVPGLNRGPSVQRTGFWGTRPNPSASDGPVTVPAHSLALFEDAGDNPAVRESTPAYEVPSALLALAQLQPTYILAEGPDGLYIVDQHAAHERILYEEFSLALVLGEVGSQMLITPQVLELDATAIATLKRFTDYLAVVGFVLEEFGAHSFVLRGVPVTIAAGAEREALVDIVDRLGEERPADREQFLRITAASLACHRAVRAGDRLTGAEMQRLLDRLRATSHPLSCPHGRPTMLRLTKSELARRFFRE
ncbi:MAG: DNA mismatch repair endonuclease MutL [Clostridia bacterium]|nr:DNA mismatch repair endonuclease MutL [Clostridia bacterium]